MFKTPLMTSLLLISAQALAGGPKHPISPMLNPQSVPVTATSAQSAATASNTNAVRVVSNVPCFIITGASPTAVSTGGSFFLPPNFPQVIPIKPADKVAAIASTGGNGSLYITEVPSLLW